MKKNVVSAFTMNQISSRLFWVSYWMYFVATVIQYTMYEDIKFVFTLCVIARYISFAGAGCKVLMDLWMQYREDRQGKSGFWSVKDPSFLCFAKYGVLMLFLAVISVTSDERSLLFVVAFLLASKGIDLGKLFRRTMVAQMILMAFIMLSAFVGLIPDLLYFRQDESVRHSLGYIYPSVAMTHLFVIILLYFWQKRDGISWKEVLWLEMINYLFFLLTDARNGFIMLAVLILVQGIVGQSKGAFWERLSETSVVRRTGPVVRFVYDFCPVLLSAFMGVLCATLQSPITQKINVLLSNRVKLAVKAVQEQGIHLLGNSVHWVGYGGNSNIDAIQDSYNFVDCSYALTLFNYGIIVFIGVLILLVLVGKQLRKKGEYHQCFLYFVMLGYCFIEPRLLELQVNTLLFLMAPMLYAPLKWRGKKS